jgi:deoxyribodipyrimidine photo-lyase
MNESLVHPTRIRILNDKPASKGGGFVLYWMQQAQRVESNQALAHAIELANQLSLPVLVGFGLMDNYPEATERHYAFMLEGLADVSRRLKSIGVGFTVLHAVPRDAAIRLAKDASVVVVDRAYLRHLTHWRAEVADAIACQLIEVETETVVPVDVATDKSEIGARTLRPRIHRNWATYLVESALAPVRHPMKKSPTGDFDIEQTDQTLARLQFIRDVKRSAVFIGGQTQALKRLDAFINAKLNGYADGRNEPAGDQTSLISPYLQYGHISPITLALAAKQSKAPDPDRDSFIEELIVRRELAHNYCQFNPRYDSYDALPNWAKASLAKHETDSREHLYSRQELEAAKTHDPYWNAAMKEAVLTGYMHNYMRMYWGKKILEWSKTPREAFDTTLYLNNRFFLDGLNVNSYGNVAWIFGQHDRPWVERPIFGQIRYMNAAGLERKFDIDAYVAKIDAIEQSTKGVVVRRSVKAGMLF